MEKEKKVHLTRVKFKDPIPHPHIDFKNQSQLRRLLASRQVVSKNSFREINTIISRLYFYHALVIKEAAPGLKGLSLRITSHLWAS